MSNGNVSSWRQRDWWTRWLNPSSRTMLIVWVTVVIGGYILYHWTNTDPSAASATEPSPKALEQAPAPNVNPAPTQVPARPAVNPTTPSGRPYNSRPPQPQPDTAGSREAVRSVQLANLKDQVQTAGESMQRLRAGLSAWQVTYAPLLTAEAGRRIAASPRHLELAEAQFRKERPAADQLGRWERNLEQLTKTVDQMAADPAANIGLTPEHAAMLKELSGQLSRAAASLADQKLLLDNLLTGTAGTAPASRTLEDALRQRTLDAKKADEERLLSVARQAHAKAQAELAARQAQLEQEKVEAENRLKLLQVQAKIDGLNEETKRLDESTKRARLEREFQRIRTAAAAHLCAFTRPGFSHRQDATKGPVSLSFIRGKGALEPTRRGMEQLMYLASVGNDRPRGPIPLFIGGDNGWRLTRTEPIEIAQQTLTKYGELMVEKGMLAP